MYICTDVCIRAHPRDEELTRYRSVTGINSEQVIEDMIQIKGWTEHGASCAVKILSLAVSRNPCP